MLKVLLIDDARPVRLVARLALARLAKVTILEAASGEAGLEIARREHPDVILLDMNMPGMSGTETLAALRSDRSTSSIPVVFLTAEESLIDAGRLHSLGARGVLSKPFDPAALSSKLSACLAAA